MIPTSQTNIDIVGILGGMGPLATIDFMQKMLAATPATCDQEHVPVVVSSIPQVPDRTAAFRGQGPSPLSAMVASGQRLLKAGAQVAVIPCNTAHLWFDDVESALGLPMLHLVDAALSEAADKVGPNACVGLLATDATIASGLYVNRRSPDGSSAGLKWLLPTAQEMLDQVMPGIAAVKAGDLQTGALHLNLAASALHQRGAQAVILGCTEIPLVLNESNAPVPVIDATAALARKTVVWARRHQNSREKSDAAT